VHEAQESFMFTYETADQKEVRRFRIAQFNGRMATVKSGDSIVTGLVRSVREKESSVPPCWTITIVPSPPKAKLGSSRPGLRIRSFADDYC
jgi:precorrin-6B methylase 1